MGDTDVLGLFVITSEMWFFIKWGVVAMAINSIL